MELRYRFLTLDDLPAIRELSDSMDMRNDPKIGETAERRIKDRARESDNAFYANNVDGIFRVKKPNFKPLTRKVASIGDPGAARVYLDRETLEAIASDYGSEVLETDSACFMLTSGLVFIAKKEKRQGR